MGRLINVFLNVSRIEAGRLKIEIEEVDINGLIQDCIKDLDSAAQERKIKLTFKINEKLKILRLIQIR